jgi:hypothetical protein
MGTGDGSDKGKLGGCGRRMIKIGDLWDKAIAQHVRTDKH